MAKVCQLLAILAIVVYSFVVPIDKHHVSAVESSRHTSHHQNVATHKDNVNSDIVFDELPVAPAVATTGAPLVTEEIGQRNKTAKERKELRKRRKNRKRLLEKKRRRLVKKLQKELKKDKKVKKPKTTSAPFIPFLDNVGSKKRVLRQKSLYDGENDDEDSDFSGSGSIPDLTGDRSFRMQFTVLEPWRSDYSNRRSSGYRVLLANVTESLERFFNDVLDDEQNHINANVRKVYRADDPQQTNVFAFITAEQPVSQTKLSRELTQQIRNYRRIGKIDVQDGNYVFNAVAECRDDEFRCNDGLCISAELKCNQVPDCGDNEDEDLPECPIYNCHENEFTCGDGHCIPKENQCDGVADCTDDTDEQDCEDDPLKDVDDNITDESCTYYEFQCDNGMCIDIRDRCNGREDCSDGSDEQKCEECKGDAFHCTSGECIHQSLRCDKRQHCADLSDEHDCGFDPAGATCKANEWQCFNGECINKDFVCDDSRDCYDNSDEANCEARQNETETQCASSEFLCDERCIPRDYMCDGRVDCSDGSDEKDCRDRGEDHNLDFDPNVFRPDSDRENGQGYPGSQPPQPFPRICPELYCRSDYTCYSYAQRCDRVRNCQDGSDEEGCPAQVPPQVPPPQKHETDANVSHSWGQSWPSQGDIKLRTYPSDQIIKEGREVVFQCRDEGSTRARVRWTRANGQGLPPNAKDINGRLEISNVQVSESGEYHCEAVGYQSYSGARATVYLTVERYNPVLDAPVGCPPEKATCMNGECIEKNQVCDGTYDCSDASDETGCSRANSCEPNEFRCANRKCVAKTWRCDGENDCGDNSDELECATMPPDAPCRFHEFQCKTGQCIPKSYQCDNHPDCFDNSDEIGCSKPTVVQTPPPRMHLTTGSIFNITCRAVGIPMPLIVWRLNWGHIPDKCHTTSVNGFGVLTCPGIEVRDSGAYSCEVINSMGTQFASPDTILVVDGTEVCPSGYFNSKATRQEDCINCFCFGVSTQCSSADLYIYSLPPPVTSLHVVGVTGPWTGQREIEVSQYQAHDVIATKFGIKVRLSDSIYETAFYALPREYLGNQLKSYGGFLTYDLEYVGAGQVNQAPDVLLFGNGYKLTHKLRGPITSESLHQVKVEFHVGTWYKEDGRQATREELMMVLANIDNFLIKLKYADNQQEVQLRNIAMDSAATIDRGLGSATLVEQCRCPVGYSGLSCEACAEGYVRQETGTWLGRCVKAPESCPAGTYLPRGESSCVTCPCPGGPYGANYGYSCYVAPDGEVACNCKPGYAGRRCEQCAPGFTGNPLVPGDICREQQTSDCDAQGTRTVDANGRCICKNNVEGRRCDQCTPSTFYLNSETANGCIHCFCMGVARQCVSSTYYRDSIQSVLSRNRIDVDIISNYDDPQLGDPQSIHASSLETVFRNVQHDDTDVYYWSLPTRFVGDKITSYGGVLNYTVRYTPQPGSAMSRNSAPDVVIKSENDITILHFRKDDIRPTTPQTYSVPILEQYWQRSDGKEVNREHLLMTLADVSYIFIKATYTTTTEEAALSHVSLDIAVPKESYSSSRAYEVEMCQCPQGYTGLSCEDCAPGYMRSDQGLYLGLCEPCQCNGHSNDCDPVTGVCQNCEHNTMGDYCELCIDGRGNATTGTPYDCIGSGDLTGCDQCDSRGFVSCSNNQCQCKSNVIGGQCDRCRTGTFDLQTENPEGCTSCFCFGASETCAASRLYREEIPMIIFSDHFRVTNAENDVVADYHELATDVLTNTVSHQVIDDRTLYWSLPSQFIGNQIYSYGGTLTYKLSTEARGGYMRDNDVIIRGNGLTLTWQNDGEGQEVVVVPFIAGVWRNGYQLATREEILTALANLDFILIRANPQQSTVVTHLSDIILQTAVTQRTVLGTAEHIEVCRCPPGYTGSSCQTCDVMHYRTASDNGRPGVCRLCPCSEHAESCSEDVYRRITCHCRPGYTGEMCDIPETPVTPDAPTISVVVTAPTLQIVEVGQTVYINCTGRHVISNLPIVVHWFKLDGRLSERAHADRGTLVITNTQIDDSGVYVCRGEKGEEIVDQRVSITVSYTRRPEVHFYPSSLDVEEYTSAQVTCEASGTPAPIIVWERIDALGRSTILLTPENSGVLRFGSIRKADEGQYRCTARNNNGEDSQILAVRVREQQRPYPPPVTEIAIFPSSFTGRPGDSVEFRCIGEGQISWRKEYTMWLPPSAIVKGHILSIENAREEDSGQYVCTAMQPTGQQLTTVANLTIIEHETRSYPKIRPLEQSHLVIENSDLYLACDATGSPLPTVKWTKLHDAFDPNVQQIGNQLRILGAKQYNRGVYVCVAENSEGTDQISTIIEIDQRQAPIVELHPKGPQTIRVGESAMLSCRSVAGIPTPVVRWVRLDNKPLPLNADDKYPGTIIIRNSAIDDGGSYQCIGENIAGTTSATAVLNVHQPPEVTIEPGVDTLELTEGDELTLTCRAIGHPTPTVQWIVPNVPRAVGDPDHFGWRTTQKTPVVFQVYEVKTNHAGMYRCLANSSAGEDEHFIRVIVKSKRGDVGPHDRDYPGHSGTIYTQDPPRHRPDGDVAHHTYTVNVGQRAQLSCEIEDSYRMTTWRRTDGYPLPLTSNLTGGTLVIERTEHDAAGTYECVMLDPEAPFIIALAQVVVVDVPMITFSPAMPIVVKSGENVVIFCNATGEGPIQVFWHGINYSPLPHTVRGEGPHLLFAPITQRDAGKYYCTAANVNGNVTKAAEVIVNRNEIVDRQPMYNQVQEVYEGDKVTLDCHLPERTERLADIQFMWRREQGQISPNAHFHDGRLTLRDIHPNDAGRYICEMLLPNGSITQSFVDVRIKKLQLDFSAHLNGNGFIELDYHTEGINRTVQHETALAIIFSTTSSNGLLLWHGQKPPNAPEGDFVALAAIGGYLEFVFRLDGQEARIRNSVVRIDDAQPHVAILKRAANQGSLELDNYIDYDETRATTRAMHLSGHIYIGGIPKASNLTGGRYRESFSGCIHVVQDITRGPINFGVFAVNAENVHSCAHPSWTSSSLVFSEVENLLNGALGGASGDVFNHNFDEINEPPPVHIIYPRPAINATPAVLTARTVIILAMIAIGQAMGATT